MMNYIDIHIIIMSDVYVNMSQSWSFGKLDEPRGHLYIQTWGKFAKAPQELYILRWTV